MGRGKEWKEGDPGLLAASPGQARAEQGVLVSLRGLPLNTAHSCDMGLLQGHARGEGERVMALESLEGTRASRRLGDKALLLTRSLKDVLN